ncbi:hypothetical protein HCH52_06395 [Oscillospiraceae bacterium HV4-5-C5C]|nr:hypothetical protein [Oscillospiraceae bacterium HV4-5-C5C]
MAETVYPQMNTLVSIASASLLTPQQISQLLEQCSCAAELRRELDGLGFFTRSDLPDAAADPEEQSAGQLLDQALDREWAGWLDWSSRIAPTPFLQELLTWPDRAHNLRILLKAHILRQDFSELYSPAAPLPDFSLTGTAAAASPAAGARSGELPADLTTAACQTAIFTALADYRVHASFSRVNLIILCLQDQEMNRLAGQLVDQRSRTFIRAWLDLEWLAVLLQMWQEKGDSHRSWLKLGREPVAGLRPEIRRLFQMDRSKQEQSLARSAYAELWQQVAVGDHLELAAFEVGRRQLLQQLRQAVRWEPFGLFPLLALLDAKQQDINLLRQINAGLRAGLSPRRLRNRLLPENGRLDGVETWLSKEVAHE